MKWRLLMAALVIVLLVGGCGPKQKEEPTPTPIPTSVVPDKPTYVVQRGVVEKKLQFSARVSPIKEENLFFKRGGYVKVVYAERGDWVKEGDILAELEIEDLMNQLAMAQLDLESAQKQYNSAVEAHQRQVYNAQMALEVAQLRLDRLKAQEPIVDLTSLEINVERAKEALEEAKIAYKEALDRPWEPQRVRDSLLKNIKNAERRYKEAQAAYNRALLQARQARQLHAIDVKLQEIEVEKAKKTLEWLQKGVDPSLAQRVESARLKVERLKAQVETGQLIAPFDGELTSFALIPGKSVEAHKTVGVIADPNEWDITADLTSSQLEMLQEGMEADVTSGLAPGKVFKAVIKQLPYPYGTGGGKAKTEDRDTRVHIVLKNPEETEFEAGDLVRVTVLIERSENTLYLPPAAIRTFEGRKFVMLRVGDRLQKVDVKLGIEGEDRVEILEGLEEGQVVEGL